MSTERVVSRVGDAAVTVRRFTVTVTAGRDQGRSARAIDGTLTVGTDEGATLRLSDPTVSRYHLECRSTDEGVLVRDLGSTNGTRAGSLTLTEARAHEPVELTLGDTRVRVTPERERAPVALSPSPVFGALLGRSAPMRAVYATLERVAPTTVPVLILGESGTGKELTAHAIHDASPRARGPFEVVDCGALPPSLAESILFGHEKGAFSGASSAHEGAFERADGGTLFLDELGELPLDLQPKLLRALGEGEVRRVSASAARKVDVRVVAATHRDLRREVNAGRFRADLYYRLAVIPVHLPPLRERLDDLEVLVPRLIERVCRERGVAPPDASPDALVAALRQHAWPGNVRELRNHIERYVVLRTVDPLAEPEPAPGVAPEDAPSALTEGLDRLPLREAKRVLVERYERVYLARVLAQTEGNVSEAARRVGVDRVTIFRALRRNGLRAAPEG